MDVRLYQVVRITGAYSRPVYGIITQFVMAEGEDDEDDTVFVSVQTPDREYYDIESALALVLGRDRKRDRRKLVRLKGKKCEITEYIPPRIRAVLTEMAVRRREDLEHVQSDLAALEASLALPSSKPPAPKPPPRSCSRTSLLLRCV